MTISKLLRPENIAKTKALATSGVRMEVKRCKRIKHPELERRLYEAVGMGDRHVSKGEIRQKAAMLSRAMKIDDVDLSHNWCARFMKQHNLTANLMQPCYTRPNSASPNATLQHLSNVAASAAARPALWVSILPSPQAAMYATPM